MDATSNRLPFAVPVSFALVLLMLLAAAGTALAGQPWELWPRGRGDDVAAANSAPGAPPNGAAAAGEAAGKATSAGITAGTVGKAAAIAAGAVAIGIAIGSGGSGGGSSTAVQH